MTTITNETFTPETQLEPINPELLVHLIRGKYHGGRAIIPGLVGEFVSLQLTDGRVLEGLCKGFKPVGSDMTIVSPFVTLETISEDGAKSKHQLPPSRIHNITT